MKPSMWIIWCGSNSRKLRTFMATSYVSNRAAWQNAHRTEKQ